MTDRERLIELLETVPPPESFVVGLRNGKRLLSTSRVADHLIANGVTVQEPKKPIEHKVDVTSIVVGNAHWCKGTTLYKCPKCGNFISRIYDYCFKCGQAFDWSDLPQPPKGE